jgi:transcriptional regulator of acetoin/glycerol metabolism
VRRPLAEPLLSEKDRKRRDELIALLKQHHGNVTATARVLGTARVQGHRWLRRFRIDPVSFRD